MASWTIRGRLIRSLISFIAVLWIAGVVIAGLIVRHEVEEVFDSALRQTTAHIIPLALHEYQLRTAGSGEPPNQSSRSMSASLRRGHMHFRLRDSSGAVVVASAGAPSDTLPLPSKNMFFYHGEFRYYVRRLDRDGLWIEVAQETHERLEAAAGILLGLLSPLLALLPIIAFAVWRTVGRATDPILRVSSELGARGGHDLAPIEIKNVPTELAPVIDAANMLMRRLQAALDTERAFAANAAHELRNPVASARAQAQLLARHLHGSPDSARAENIASQLGQLGRRVERLLQLSRAEAGLGHAREQTDLGAIVGLISEEYSSRTDVGGRLHIFHPDSESCWVLADPDALAIIVRNVIENAVHYGSGDAAIDITIGCDSSLRVVNGCPPLPAEVLNDLTRRFRRAGKPEAGGTGLGLAIVDTLMRQAGGSVELNSPATGRDDGFEVVLRFPSPRESERA